MTGEIISNASIAKDIYEMDIEFKDADFGAYTPGQFIHVKIPGAPDKLLRRPFSIYSANEGSKRVSIVYAVVGEGTRLLSTAREKESLDALLFLGNGFKLAGCKSALLIGGGLGVAPLAAVAERYLTISFDFIAGFKSGEYCFGLERLNKLCALTVCTEDGSVGTAGFVTDALKSFDLNAYDAVLCCGPAPMTAALSPMLAFREAWVSLEERMGCGMGGCAVCVCTAVNGNRPKVCVDGPVFKLADLVL